MQSISITSYLRLLLFIVFMAGSSYLAVCQTEFTNQVFTHPGLEDCCFQLAYQYDVPQNINNLETKILSPGVTFSSVDYSLGGGWQQTVWQQQRRLNWTWTGGEIPSGYQELFQFCLTGWNTMDSIALAVFWRTDQQVVQRDTLLLLCNTCWQAPVFEITCLPDSTYLSEFTFTNKTSFSVDQLQIQEPPGQDLISEDSIMLPAPLGPNSSLEGLQLHLRADAVSHQELCFSITPKQLIAPGIAVACCTASYCFPIPACDRCCTSYEDFELAVEQGFAIQVDCESERVTLQANALNDCDQVRFVLSDLGAGIVDGDEAISFGGLSEDTWYEICMTATRRDASGEDCFTEASLTTCSPFFYDCNPCVAADQIDWEVSCANTVDLVCGCDGMTYLNACAALSWSGIQTWQEGPCGEQALDTIILSATLNDDLQTLLSWTNEGITDYRYYLVQRRIPDGPWITMTEVSNSTFEFVDNNPLLPEVIYRIIGVTWPGKVVISNLGIINLVPTHERIEEEDFHVWPNPTTTYLHISLPLSQSLTLQLWNPQGQLILEFYTNSEGYYQLDTSAFPAGCYLLTGNLAHSQWRKKIILL